MNSAPMKPINTMKRARPAFPRNTNVKAAGAAGAGPLVRH